jgi:hypothetical protein
MSVFDKIAEEKIQEAMRRGEFDNLEGRGRPLVFEDDSMVPPELRMAYKLLKNSGHVPPELLEEREVHNLVELLSGCTDEQEKYRQIRKLNFMVTQLNLKRRRPVNLEQAQYYDKVVDRVRLEGKDKKDEEYGKDG